MADGPAVTPQNWPFRLLGALPSLAPVRETPEHRADIRRVTVQAWSLASHPSWSLPQAAQQLLAFVGNDTAVLRHLRARVARALATRPSLIGERLHQTLSYALQLQHRASPASS